MVSTGVCVVLEVPGPKVPMVTPCSFMQFLYEANATLFAPLPPRAPLGWRLAQAWMAFWNFEKCRRSHLHPREERHWRPTGAHLHWHPRVVYLHWHPRVALLRSIPWAA